MIRRARALALCLLCCTAAAVPSDVRRWMSSDSGARLQPQSDIPWQHGGSATKGVDVAVTIDPTKLFQVVRGFGASFLESGAINLNSLPPDKQEELLDLLFGAEGAGLSAMKATIPSNDFASNGKWHTYDDVRGDVDMRNFSVACDLSANGTLSFIKRAQQHGFRGLVQSYMDYPPDWMLEGLLPSWATVAPRYFDALALYFAKYVQAYRDHGVTIDYLSMFNEPVDSYTDIHDRHMAQLLGQHVGPLFDRLGLRNNTKLTYGGQATRASAEKHVRAVMTDSEARKYMDHIAYHGYDCQYNCTHERQNYGSIGKLHSDWPALELWMTEICYAYNGDDPRCTRPETMSKCTDYPRNHSLAPALPRLDFSDGRVWGSRIVSDLAAGASGWIYWNLILDMSGGPFQYSPLHNDGAKNLQQAVIHVDPVNGTYHTTGLFWYLAHFSRFIRNGMHRIYAVASGRAPSDQEGAAGVEVSAFTGGGQVVVQVLNHDTAVAQVALNYSGKVAHFEAPPVSVTTATWDI